MIIKYKNLKTKAITFLVALFLFLPLFVSAGFFNYGPQKTNLITFTALVKKQLYALSNIALIGYNELTSNIKSVTSIKLAQLVNSPSPPLSLLSTTLPTPSFIPTPTSTVLPPVQPDNSISKPSVEGSSFVALHKLFRQAGTSQIFFYRDGELHYVPDTATLNSLGFRNSDVFVISPETFVLFQISDPIESVVVPFSDREVVGIKSLFKIFFREEDLVLNDQSILGKISSDLQNLKVEFNKKIPQNTITGNSTTPFTFGGGDAIVKGNSVTGGNVKLSGNSITTTSGNLGLPATVEFNSVAYTWPSADGSANQRLTTNGSGTLSWATVSGSVSSNSLDFDEFVSTMLLDANLTINRGGFFFGLGAAPSTVFEVQGTSSASYLLTGNTLQVGGFSSAAYSRFGINATDFSNFISTTNDLLISGDLEVDATANFDSFVRITNTATSSLNFRSGSDNEKKFTIRSNYTGAGTTDRLSILNNLNTELLTIASNGYVGIGTTSPNQTLQLFTTAGSNPAIYLSDGDVAHGATGIVPTNVYGYLTNRSATNGGLYIESLSENNSTPALELIGVIGAGGTTDAAVVFRATEVSGTSRGNLEPAELAFQFQNNNTNLLTIEGGGDVGIGTTSPTSLLTVQGRGEFQGTASASYLLTGNTLQVGSYSSAAYSRFGTGTAGNSMDTIDDLFVGGDFEVISSISIGNFINVSATHVCRNATSKSLGGCTAHVSEFYPVIINDRGIKVMEQDLWNIDNKASVSEGELKKIEEEKIKIDTALDGRYGGSVVSITDVKNQVDDPTAPFLARESDKSYDPAILGVISLIAQGGNGNRLTQNYLPLTLAGRVKVKISLENGPIKVGDYLTSSSIPGVAMKATKPGRVIGVALENSKLDPSKNTVMTFINPHWFGRNEDIITQLADLSNSTITSSNEITMTNVVSSVVDYLNGAVLKVKTLITDFIKTQILEVEKGITIKDKATGEPYCIEVINGQILANKGACEAISSPTLEPIEIPQNSSSESPGEGNSNENSIEGSTENSPENNLDNEGESGGVPESKIADTTVDSSEQLQNE